MEFIDFLLVEKLDESVAVVVAESQEAKIGSLVSFNGGELGHVVMKAWAQKGDDVDRLISAVVPVFEAEKIYKLSWEREAVQNADDPGSP